jgi:hypothetical protein
MKKKPYSKMTASELAEATREYDRPDHQPKFANAPPKFKATHDRIVKAIRRKRGRPAIGAGAERIQVTMERGLLGRADAYAKRHGLSRAQVLAQAVKNMLSGAA